jgi:hypothetical protein
MDLHKPFPRQIATHAAIAIILQIASIELVHANEECNTLEQYAKDVYDDKYNGKTPQKPEEKFSNVIQLACGRLAFTYSSIKENKENLENLENLKVCYETKCKFEGNMKNAITHACNSKKDEPICVQWENRFTQNKPFAMPAESKQQSRLRLGLGGTLVGVGIVSAVLGTVHILYPIFKSDLTFDSKFSCAVDGVRTECVPNQLGLGIPLIAVGGLSIGLGGAFLNGRFPGLDASQPAPGAASTGGK